MAVSDFWKLMTVKNFLTAKPNTKTLAQKLFIYLKDKFTTGQDKKK